MPIEISLDTLLAEYDRLGLTSADADGLTMDELCDRWGVGSSVVRKRLKVAQKAGILRNGKKKMVALNGVTIPVACYWIELPKKSKKK